MNCCVSPGIMFEFRAQLYSVQLHELVLSAALRWLAEQMSRHGLTFNFLSISCDSVPLTEDQAMSCTSRCRALMNIVKHAGVTRAVVAFEVADSDKLQHQCAG